MFKDGLKKNKEPDVPDKKLPDWLTVDRTTFNQIKYKVKKVKDKNIYVRSNRGLYISAEDSYKLIKDIEYGEITHEETLKKKMNDVRSDILKKSNQESFYENQALTLNTLFLVDEIFTGEFKQYKLINDKYELFESKRNQEESDTLTQQSKEQPDTTDMPDLEIQESAVQRTNRSRLELKILTPNQMFSRLPISLAQLKAENNSEKLKNEIRQLLYSVYRSKKLTKQLYKSLIGII